ncbi:50S ribosomal protein L25/general stress protein Ctc [Nocardioides marmoriginsengisoli]|uniref:Large ribosomal subunit protein bL25 n=1 Tax=Nocardioides marmoriginsengisoli TaxID=661483 RepID=A0A3N0CHZ6_9ACTN|nr:50S ribosomal protein L25/general stress protein Ctc [Nocardioides marmoriginsengisoli]RNL62583.1 50S ribosomal protein L25/general stress protein Ctc [Nocardioides marmoriginsengisoli]
MSEDLIKAEARTEFGKGAARRIRRDNKVPAVIYGHGEAPVHVTLPAHDTLMALKHGGANAVLNIEVDGTVQLALTKQVQADPLKGFLEHVDFVAVKKGEKVTVEVPVHLVGEANKEAFVQLENNVVTLEAEATHIPEQIEVSVEGAEPGLQIHASELTLPKGSTLISDAELLIVNVTQAKSAAAAEAELAEATAEVAGDAPAAEEPAAEESSDSE